MKVFKSNRSTITFDDSDDNWIRFDRLSNGSIVVDKFGEPALTPDDIAVLLAWIGGAQ